MHPNPTPKGAPFYIASGNLKLEKSHFSESVNQSLNTFFPNGSATPSPLVPDEDGKPAQS